MLSLILVNDHEQPNCEAEKTRDRHILTDKQNALRIKVGLDCIIVPDPAIEGLSIPPPPLPPPPPSDSPTLSVVLASAAVAALSFVLLADVSGFIGIVRSPAPVRPTPQVQFQISDRPTNITNRSTNRVPRSNRRLPRDLEERLQKCLEEVFKSQSELLQRAEEVGLSTDPATLVPLLIGVEQEEPTDPAVILIRDLKAAIEGCDPSLLEAILEAEQQNVDSSLSVEAFQGIETKI